MAKKIKKVISLEKLSMGLSLFLASCTGSSNHLTPITHIPPVVFSCPDNFVLSPIKVGAKSFCVQKTEAEIKDGAALLKQVSGPSVVQKRSVAQQACAGLGPRFSLISNAEWQALTRDIEQNSRNWSLSFIAKGALNSGHADANPGFAILADPLRDGCFLIEDTECTAGNWSYSKRTHQLSSGDFIWDLAGNLDEWVSDDPPNLDFSEVQNGIPLSELKSPALKSSFGSSVPTALLDQAVFGGLGYIADLNEGDPSTDKLGILRGGSFEDSVWAGLFSTKINVLAESDASTHMSGFRCVYK